MVGLAGSSSEKASEQNVGFTSDTVSVTTCGLVSN